MQSTSKQSSPARDSLRAAYKLIGFADQGALPSKANSINSLANLDRNVDRGAIPVTKALLQLMIETGNLPPQALCIESMNEIFSAKETQKLFDAD